MPSHDLNPAANNQQRSFESQEYTPNQARAYGKSRQPFRGQVFTPLHWNDVDLYPLLLQLFFDAVEVPFDQQDLIDYANKAKPHDPSDSLKPTGIRLVSGHGAHHDWHTACKMLEWRLKDLGYTLEFAGLHRPATPRFLPGSEQSPYFQIEPVYYDLGAFWKEGDNVDMNEIRQRRETWPAIDLIWFAALQAEVLIKMNGVQVPNLAITGLVVDSGMTLLLSVHRKQFTLSVLAESKVSNTTSFVSFRQ